MISPAWKPLPLTDVSLVGGPKAGSSFSVAQDAPAAQSDAAKRQTAKDLSGMDGSRLRMTRCRIMPLRLRLTIIS